MESLPTVAEICSGSFGLHCPGPAPLDAAVVMRDATLIRRPVKLNLKQGLHIRACSRVVALVGPFSGQILIHYGTKSADASSMFDLVQLAALPGADLVLEGNGEGADAILDALVDFLSRPSEPSE